MANQSQGGDINYVYQIVYNILLWDVDFTFIQCGPCKKILYTTCYTK